MGYACVSTTGQDLDALLVALAATRHALERVIPDKLLGSAKGARPGCRRCRAPALLISRLVSWVDDLWCGAIGAGV
ncbi:hypothetical protein OQ889_23670 [Mycobacterium ulcerans]|nr:hypothetical protein [Mycobacterium ulcerans]